MERKPRILVVDDHDAHRHLMRLTLSAKGFEVAVASDGWEALEHLQQHTPDAMMLDVHMPGMTGLELARQARALRRELRHVPLFFMTALANDEVRREADAVGASRLLHKPVSDHELRSALDPWLGQDAPSDEGEGA